MYIKFFIGGILYSTREHDIENYFKKVGELVDVAVMRDKNSGRSRGFAFVTFVVHPTYSETNDGKKSDYSKCAAAQELNHSMLHPQKPHLVQGRAVEIRVSDGGKPSDSFIVKKNQQRSDRQSDRRDRRERKRSRERREKRGNSSESRQKKKRSRSRRRRSRSNSGGAWSNS